MSRSLQHVPLFESNIVKVVDVRCNAPQSRAGSEEHNEDAGFIFPRRGAFEWHTRDLAALADCNTVLFIRGGESYRIGHPAHGGDDCTTARFDSDALFDALPCAPKPLHTILLSTPKQRRIQHLLLSLLTQRNDRLACDDLALTVLRIVCEEMGSERRPQPRPSKDIDEARSLIATYPEADLSLHQISKMFHVSPYHLARRFRAARGISIHQYRIRVRLSLAVKRISEGCTNFCALALRLAHSAS